MRYIRAPGQQGIASLHVTPLCSPMQRACAAFLKQHEVGHHNDEKKKGLVAERCQRPYRILPVDVSTTVAQQSNDVAVAIVSRGI